MRRGVREILTHIPDSNVPALFQTLWPATVVAVETDDVAGSSFLGAIEPMSALVVSSSSLLKKVVFFPSFVSLYPLRFSFEAVASSSSPDVTAAAAVAFEDVADDDDDPAVTGVDAPEEARFTVVLAAGTVVAADVEEDEPPSESF